MQGGKEEAHLRHAACGQGAAQQRQQLHPQHPVLGRGRAGGQEPLQGGLYNQTRERKGTGGGGNVVWCGMEGGAAVACSQGRGLPRPVPCLPCRARPAPPASRRRTEPPAPATSRTSPAAPPRPRRPARAWPPPAAPPGRPPPGGWARGRGCCPPGRASRRGRAPAALRGTGWYGTRTAGGGCACGNAKYVTVHWGVLGCGSHLKEGGSACPLHNPLR